MKFDNFSNFYKIYQIWKGWFSASRYQKSMIETAFESWKDVFFYKKKISKNCNFFLHLLILYCTAKRYIKPKMCITMIFMTFHDFLIFDNIKKKWIGSSPLIAIVKAWLKENLKAGTMNFCTRKILLKIIDFFLLIHTLLWCTMIKKFFAVFHQKLSKNADFWKLKNLFQS